MDRSNRRLFSEGYLPTLDGWRAVAILAVISCHAGVLVFGPGGTHENPRISAKFYLGVYGVDIFFGISGLLICGRLLQEARRYGRFDLRHFYIRRLFRILPPALTYILVIAGLVTAHQIRISWLELVSCVLFFRNYLPASREWSSLTAHFWSLAVEEHFYLIWPLLLAFLGDRRARHWVVPLAIAIALWRFGLARYYFHGQLPRGFFSRSDTRLDAILWGCWAALLIDGGWTPFLTRVLTRSTGIVLGLLCLIFVVFQLPLNSIVLAAAIPFVLLSTVLHPEDLLGRVLECSGLRWIGRLSYSLYIWQQLFLPWPQALALRPLPLASLQAWPMNFAGIFICAIASYYLIEKPAISFGRLIIAKVGRLPSASESSASRDLQSLPDERAIPVIP